MTNSLTPEQVLAQPFTLPNGAIIKNRLVKSAMAEALGTTDNRVTDGLPRLYQRWAEGGIGLLITGNVMIDQRALGEPNCVVVEDERDLDALRAWAVAGTKNETQLWMQINHPGKQVPKGLNKESVAPSAIPFRKDMKAYFSTPRELTEVEILEIIQRYARTAAVAKKAGFSGVQIHGAHGYLVSQFLSGHHNIRNDQWGGNPENRRRFVLSVFEAIRSAVGPDFPIGIKLNSADFQRGGFTEEESLDVIRALSAAGVDMIEVSGGTYEEPVMAGVIKLEVKDSTRQREAYFLEFAEKARAAVKTPLMVTGGFRTAAVMADAISSDAIDLVGIARVLAVEPNAPELLLSGQTLRHPIKPLITGISLIDKKALMEVAWYGLQLRRMGRGSDPKPNQSALLSFFFVAVEQVWNTLKTKLARVC
jgi:2,4-dienoyl-CoA reductase-like NADH-dependent reductase (Old Yellow Enzyme family)